MVLRGIFCHNHKGTFKVTTGNIFLSIAVEGLGFRHG